MSESRARTLAKPSTRNRQQEIESLGPWFHNLHLPDGRQTAPDHVLGDFPAFKWRHLAASIPQDLTGWSVLDIGCNAGYYSIELARRGARVTGMDIESRYLEQARWAAEQTGLQLAPGTCSECRGHAPYRRYGACPHSDPLAVGHRPSGYGQRVR